MRDALEGLGWALFWLDRTEEALEVRERAFRRYREAGDQRSAARLAYGLAVDCIDLRGEAGASPAPAPGPPATDHPLTSRELEVLRLVAGGLGDKEIADRLHLSGHTVHRHISNIRTKLGLPSRSAAVAWAAQKGLL